MTPRKPKKHWYSFLFKEVDIEAGSGRKLKAPVMAVLLILIIIGFILIMLFSDWKCGKWFSHEADDVGRTVHDIKK